MFEKPYTWYSVTQGSIEPILSFIVPYQTRYYQEKMPNWFFRISLRITDTFSMKLAIGTEVLMFGIWALENTPWRLNIFIED